MKLALALGATVSVFAATATGQTETLILSHHDYPGRVSQLDSSGTLVGGAVGNGNFYFGAAVDRDGQWFTTRRQPNGFERFSATGAFLGEFVTYELNGYAGDISVFADGTLAVCNLSASGGVHLYAQDGTHLGYFATGAQAWTSTIDALDRLWVVHLTNNPNPPSTISTFDRTGNLLQSFQVNYVAGDLAVAPGGDLWIADYAGNVDHRSSTGAPLGSFPTNLGPGLDGIALMHDGTLWVVDEQHAQLGHFDAAGALLAVVVSPSIHPALLAVHDPCPGFSSYCTAGTSANGCTATLATSGTPSVSNASACTVAVINVEALKQTLIFYGASGPLALPWASGSSSLLCVKPPTQRVFSSNSGGTFGACNGAVALDLNAWLASHPAALGQPLQVGQALWLQAWYRDPVSPKTTSLSDALYVRMCP